ncbi:hypothetical protein [Hansschlegelia zhihuaiae]|uniref:Uncharacterized protein n=1 Tax=Hansschlegelia zhihuaiae TaxID=405005 RepID=A0A4Q0MFY0_9HYPH|nr:hypothetical protein [Hansschlegelia zhihuaiae]RXF72123.1 hypothetical protein EK403_15040 [Hansschlegelia zhihuaiae]
MTTEGRRAADILTLPGMWRRAGLEGRVTGLDYGAAIAASPSCDPAALGHCLERGEAATLRALSERRETSHG